MITFELFLVLAAVVVVIGFIVWRRDVKAGRVMRSARGPVTVMRERWIGRSTTSTAAPTSAGPPGTKADAADANRTDADAGDGA
ncbi:MAG: hypothetical protein DYH14_10600 [Betaproteobacteria bacterium PRO3]|nr:hypothetical protein [Betaproteobacteria bacterium PRO3]